MQLAMLKEHIIGESFAANLLGSGVICTTEIPTHNGNHNERAIMAEVEVSFAGLTGGAADTATAVRAVGYPFNSGITFPLSAEEFDTGKRLFSTSNAGLFERNGDVLFGNDVLAGRGSATFVKPGGVWTILDDVLVVSLIVRAGASGWTGGTFTFEKVRLFGLRG